MTPEQAETGRIGVELMAAWSADDHDVFRSCLRAFVDTVPSY